MDNQAIYTGKMPARKGRHNGALKLLLIAGFSVQAWGFVMGLCLIVANIMMH